MRKYKFKIKKENERCLEYLVEDHDLEEENVKFTIPLAFQVAVRFTIKRSRDLETGFSFLKIRGSSPKLQLLQDILILL